MIILICKPLVSFFQQLSEDEPCSTPLNLRVVEPGSGARRFRSELVNRTALPDLDSAVDSAQGRNRKVLNALISLRVTGNGLDSAAQGIDGTRRN